MAMRGDFNVLKFNTYEEYLRSFTRMDEYRYLNSKRMINAVIKLGYRTNATIYEEAEFYELQKDLLLLLNPKSTTTTLFSNHLKSDDPALIALARREEPNMQKKLSVRVSSIIAKPININEITHISYLHGRQLYYCNCDNAAVSIYRAI